MANDKTTASRFSFAALDPRLEQIIYLPTEEKAHGRDWVTWGTNNAYPFYLEGLCHSVPTLRSIILGLVDYVCGDEVEVLRGLRDGDRFDRRGTTGRQIVRATAESIAKKGGFAWKITRNVNGTPGEIEVLDPADIRTDEDNEVFYYSEEWEKRGSSAKTIMYPKWMPEATDIAESILWVKVWGGGAYPEPLYAASIKACETERSIDEFHLGNIERGFMGSYIVNFNGGTMPTDREKEEVERTFTEKFGGKKNAGRIMFSWNRNKDSQTTLTKMEVADYGEKYETLAKHCRQQIFTAFRANPNLFGVNTENNGFTDEDFDKSFKLFNRTMVQPIQRAILDGFEAVMGVRGTIRIHPFTLEGATENTEA